MDEFPFALDREFFILYQNITDNKPHSKLMSDNLQAEAIESRETVPPNLNLFSTSTTVPLERVQATQESRPRVTTNIQFTGLNNELTTLFNAGVFNTTVNSDYEPSRDNSIPQNHQQQIFPDASKSTLLQPNSIHRNPSKIRLSQQNVIRNSSHNLQKPMHGAQITKQINPDVEVLIQQSIERQNNILRTLTQLNPGQQNHAHYAQLNQNLQTPNQESPHQHNLITNKENHRDPFHHNRDLVAQQNPIQHNLKNQEQFLKNPTGENSVDILQNGANTLAEVHTSNFHDEPLRSILTPFISDQVFSTGNSNMQHSSPASSVPHTDNDVNLKKTEIKSQSNPLQINELALTSTPSQSANTALLDHTGNQIHHNVHLNQQENNHFRNEIHHNQIHGSQHNHHQHHTTSSPVNSQIQIPPATSFGQNQVREVSVADFIDPEFYLSENGPQRYQPPVGGSCVTSFSDRGKQYF